MGRLDPPRAATRQPAGTTEQEDRPVARPPAHPRRPRVARPARALDGPRRAARRDGRGAGALLRRLRPDRAEPAHGQPRADRHRPAAAGRRARAVRAGRRRDRADRRPARVGGAHDEPRRDRAGVGRQGPAADRAVPRRSRATTPRRWSNNYDWTVADVGDRLPARHRQALPGQPDARPRGGAVPARERHQLHRVQLRPAAVDGLPRALPPARRHGCSSAAATSGATSPAASS